MKLGNQKGSATSLIVLSLSVSVAVVASSFLMWFGYHEKSQAKSRAVEDSNNLSTSLKMMLSTRAACDQNLTPNAFGTNISSLGPATNVSILVPGPGGTATVALFSAGQYYEGLMITSVLFSNPRYVDSAAESSYISELTVSYKVATGQADRTVVMPFYFTTDASGKIVDCLMTSYLPLASTAPQGTVPATMEDLLCSQNAAASGDTQAYIYLPQNKLCVVKPQVTSPVVQN